jgi:hypothetical protein
MSRGSFGSLESLDKLKQPQWWLACEFKNSLRMKFTTADLVFENFCNDVISLDINEVHVKQPWPGCREVDAAGASSYCPFELHGDYVEAIDWLASLNLIQNNLLLIMWMFKYQNTWILDEIIKIIILITNPKNKNKDQILGKMMTYLEVKFGFISNKILHMEIEFIMIILIKLATIMDVTLSQIKNMGQDFGVMTWFFNWIFGRKTSHKDDLDLLNSKGLHWQRLTNTHLTLDKEVKLRLSQFSEVFAMVMHADKMPVAPSGSNFYAIKFRFVVQIN